MVRSTRMFIVAYAMLLVLTASSLRAATFAEFSFSDPAQAQAFRELGEQLRCLVCQNESIAASQAELAKDLRRQIYEMMQAGKNKMQIIEFLVARYGNFVLYSPPVKPATYFLWYGPFLLCGIAGFFLVRALRQQKQAQQEELSAEEHARLATILNDKTSLNDKIRNPLS